MAYAHPSLNLSKTSIKDNGEKQELHKCGNLTENTWIMNFRCKGINWCQVTGTLKRTHCHCSDIFDKNKGNINLSLKNLLCKFQSIDNYSFCIPNHTFKYLSPSYQCIVSNFFFQKFLRNPEPLSSSCLYVRFLIPALKSWCCIQM